MFFLSSIHINSTCGSYMSYGYQLLSWLRDQDQAIYYGECVFEKLRFYSGSIINNPLWKINVPFKSYNIWLLIEFKEFGSQYSASTLETFQSCHNVNFFQFWKLKIQIFFNYGPSKLLQFWICSISKEWKYILIGLFERTV